MVFKNPHLLYGLLFLIVPIIIHLFQLRRFKKVAFTNVAFLKPLVSQTRKSRVLKKWLVLLMRMLAIACIVLAFAQPYIPAQSVSGADKQTVIYLDNSFSMQAQGNKGALYDTAVNELLDYLPADKEFSLFTNDQSYNNVTKKDIANELLRANYSSNTIDYKELELKSRSLLDRSDRASELILISDFQKYNNNDSLPKFEPFVVKKVQLMAQEVENISIDSAYLNPANSKQLIVTLSSNEPIDSPVTLTLKNKDLLVAKTAATLEDREAQIALDLPQVDYLEGVLSIKDTGLQFDNELFISYNKNQQVKVLIISESDDSYLLKLLNDERFKVIATNLNQANYNLIKDQNFIIINELQNIPPALNVEFNKFTNNGGRLLIIPSDKPMQYNGLLTNERLKFVDNPVKMTGINYDHPLFNQVFNKKVTNFQYPTISKRLLPYNAANTILSYEDGSSFLYQNGRTYNFTAALNLENTNFQNSPLIVPVFYNMVMSSLPLPKLYYSMDRKESIAVPTAATNDDVLKLSTTANDEELIPLQRSFNSYTSLEIGNEIKLAANYNVLFKQEQVGILSFNIPRSENDLQYYTSDELGTERYTGLKELFIALSQEEKINSLWQLFICGGLFFLLCEVLILKFLK